MKTRKRVHLTRTVSVAMAVIMSLGIFVLPSFANSGTINGSSFEGIDGNTSKGGHEDWNSVTQSEITFQDDKVTGGGDDSFGGGAKEDTPVPTVVDGSIPPNKSDLKEFGAFREGNFLHLFWTRVQDPSGTTNMDFELNQKSCVRGSGIGCSANGVTPTRTLNDLLITYDLSNGGTTATIRLRRWTEAGWTAAQDLDVNVASGSINSESSVTLTGRGSYSTRTFGEASINLNAIFTSQACQTFGSAYLKSRSSDSFTAALKDFIAPTAINLTNCGRLVIHKRVTSAGGAFLAGAGFTISPANENGVSALTESTTGVFCLDNLRLGSAYTVTESTVPLGYAGAAPQSLTVGTASSCTGVGATTTPDATFINNRLQGHIDIIKTDDSAPTNLPLSGAGFTAYKDASPMTGQTAPGTEDNVSAGTCTTAAATGLCAIGPLDTGTYWVVETRTPTGYATAAPRQVVVSGDNQRFPLTFVNPRTFKVITLVCKEATNTLYQSSVTLGTGPAKNSLSSPPAGITEAQLCALGGASFEGKTANSTTPYGGNVTIAP